MDLFSSKIKTGQAKIKNVDNCGWAQTGTFESVCLFITFERKKICPSDVKPKIHFQSFSTRPELDKNVVLFFLC